MLIINILTKILPFLGPLLEKFSGKNSELKEQKQLEELRAFQAGRVTPRYVLLYCLCGIFTVFCVCMTLSFFFPQIAPDFSLMRELIKLGQELGVD